MIAQETTRFPAYLSEIKELVKSHKQLEDERLLLAIYYAPDTPGRSPQDVFLFEVYEGFRQNRIGPDGDFEEICYGSTEAFPLDRNQRLHIVLTNPVEFKVGMKAEWPLAQEVREAARSKQYKKVYVAPAYEALWEPIRG